MLKYSNRAVTPFQQSVVGLKQIVLFTIWMIFIHKYRIFKYSFSLFGVHDAYINNDAMQNTSLTMQIQKWFDRLCKIKNFSEPCTLNDGYAVSPLKWIYEYPKWYLSIRIFSKYSTNRVFVWALICSRYQGFSCMTICNSNLKLVHLIQCIFFKTLNNVSNTYVSNMLVCVYLAVTLADTLVVENFWIITAESYFKYLRPQNCSLRWNALFIAINLFLKSYLYWQLATIAAKINNYAIIG